MAGQKGMLLNPKDSPNESVPILAPEMVRVFVTGGTGGDVNWLAGVGRWTHEENSVAGQLGYAGEEIPGHRAQLYALLMSHKIN